MDCVPMTITGDDVPPKRAWNAEKSASVLTEYSVKGTPRWRSAWRAWSQPGQLRVEYRVTGYLLIAWRVSYGRPAAPAGEGVPLAGGMSGAAGGLAVYVPLPSGPTILYCASAATAVPPSSSATAARRARR